MPKYRVKPGMYHGANNRFGPGEEVELTTEEAAGFLDKLEPIAEAPEFDLATAKVDEVLIAVDTGVISAAEALEFELAHKKRTSLLEPLEELVAQD